MNCETGLLGFGEAAQAFSSDARWMARAAAYDIKTEIPALRGKKLGEYKEHTVLASDSIASLCDHSPVILSLVTADQAAHAAMSMRANLRPETFYIDMNSVSPGTKRGNAAAIADGGGDYVDVAIMAPVHPAQLDVPLLISGRSAERAEAHLKECGFQNTRIIGPEIGQASAIKMIRSVMIKGIEALTAECLLAAHASGLTDEVLSSLGENWPERANYNLERMLVHGNRRAAEMEEVCLTLEQLGITPRMSQATAQWQYLTARSTLPPDRLSQKLDDLFPTLKADVV